jgi:3-deoxy-manno-octulosonate cytidylyltransferase (CMP-KDO synthetase)
VGAGVGAWSGRGYRERMAHGAVVIVPARLASTRFAEKVLADRTGRPLVQHVVDAVRQSAVAERVVVATDHARVAEALRPFGTQVVMTRVDHPNGTSRLAEAAAALGLGEDQVIVNAQGDEPEMAGEVITAAVRALLETPGAVVGTAAAPLGAAEELGDRNVVKVVRALSGAALYFSRAGIPVDRDGRGLAAARPLRHIGVYAYRRGFLERYVAMPATPLEQSEQLEQLRVLEHGLTIGVGLCATAQPGIDTPEQYDAFVSRWRARNG